KGRGSPSGSRPLPACDRSRRSGQTACGFWPSATYARRRRPPWWRRAGGCCGCRSRSRASRRSTPNTSTRSTRESAMQREGSALHGLGVVMMKELSDHLNSVRMRVLEWLVVLFALAALYNAIQQIKDVTAEDPFLFLRLFTTARESIPITFVSFLSILVPLLAIRLGFDAVNSEHNRRSLARVLSQPIYRDALLFGKFFAGLITLSISLIALWLLVIGLGLLLLGVPPNAEEMARAFIFLLVTIAYAGVWLAL